jgi:hypothetical protein
MSDPNLRRLLDVSMRKNPDRDANHYVFKKRNDRAAMERHVSNLGFVTSDAEIAHQFLAMSEILEEQDSTNLGLKPIWIDNYDELPVFLRSLAADWRSA